MLKNWVYYMQRGLQSMWKSKEVPDYRKESYKDIEKKWRQDDASELLDEIDPHYVKREKNWSQKKHEQKVFETIDFKECGCLPDCGCKEWVVGCN